MKIFFNQQQLVEKIWLLEPSLDFEFLFLQSKYYSIIFVTKYSALGISRPGTNSENVSFSLSLVLFLLVPPFCCSFLPLDTVMQRMGRFNEPKMTWHRHVGNLLSESVVQRCPFFLRTPRFERVLGLVSSRFRWRAVIMRSRMTSRHAVDFFAMNVCHAWLLYRHDRANVCFTQVSYRYEFVTIISREGNDEKYPGYHINNILVIRNRWRDDANRSVRYFESEFFIKNTGMFLFHLPLHNNFLHCAFSLWIIFINYL